VSEYCGHINISLNAVLRRNADNPDVPLSPELTTAIGLKQNVLTSTSLATLLNTTTDFVINGAKID
jgi:hypothetical protein